MCSAHSKEVRVALKAGRSDVFNGAQACEAREGLAKAIDFFKRAKGQLPSGEENDQAEDVRLLLAEALFTLAKLTQDENKREEL
ncbi:hypothetical protein EVJ58_g11066 [Rhodofomes roseus]|uniref:Uncharacterized protein n=1 Tax=Rhodofomes roseus TaxID=34475 RepID=A0A4Y9XK96_9APHY|nr:hypothetical protein EVJ58_g11066 [Rhodofomes roseus]